MDILIGSEDVYIHDDVEFRQRYSIGNHVAVDKGVYCSTNIDIGDYVHISPYVTIIGGPFGLFTAKGFNNIMAGARIICGSDRFDDSGLFGAMIPDWVLLTAGSLLIGDTVPWGVYKGNPAVLTKVIDKTKALETIKLLGYEL